MSETYRGKFAEKGSKTRLGETDTRVSVSSGLVNHNGVKFWLHDTDACTVGELIDW